MQGVGLAKYGVCFEVSHLQRLLGALKADLKLETIKLGVAVLRVLRV